MKGLLGSLIRRGATDDADNIVFRPSKQFTRQDLARIAERGATEFRNRAMNLISCFGPLDGEFGLYGALSNFIQTKGALTDEISEAVSGGDEITLTETFVRVMQLSFVTLYEKNALARLQLVENLPAEAMFEFIHMKKSIGNGISTPAVASSVRTVAAPVVTETPAEVAAREWKELSGDQFRIKYLNHQGNRKFYEQALAQGLIR
jgi:hypothetical protein